MDDAREFAEKILKGMGFDLKLIGDAPMHIEADIAARDANVARAAAEAMREKAAKLVEGMAQAVGTGNLAPWNTAARVAERIRAILLPAAGDAPICVDCGHQAAAKDARKGEK